jgi:hypothetical protein
MYVNGVMLWREDRAVRQCPVRSGRSLLSRGQIGFAATAVPVTCRKAAVHRLDRIEVQRTALISTSHEISPLPTGYHRQRLSPLLTRIRDIRPRHCVEGDRNRKSIRPQQVVTGEIFTSPQSNPGAIIHRVDCDDRIRIRERNLAWRTCRHRCIEEQVVEQALGVRCS